MDITFQSDHESLTVNLFVNRPAKSLLFVFLAALYRLIALGNTGRAIVINYEQLGTFLSVYSFPIVYDRWSWLERAQSYAWSLKLAIPVWLWDMRPGDSTDCDFRTNGHSPASYVSCPPDTSPKLCPCRSFYRFPRVNSTSFNRYSELSWNR